MDLPPRPHAAGPAAGRPPRLAAAAGLGSGRADAGAGVGRGPASADAATPGAMAAIGAAAGRTGDIEGAMTGRGTGAGRVTDLRGGLCRALPAGSVPAFRGFRPAGARRPAAV